MWAPLPKNEPQTAVPRRAKPASTRGGPTTRKPVSETLAPTQFSIAEQPGRTENFGDDEETTREVREMLARVRARESRPCEQDQPQQQSSLGDPSPPPPQPSPPQPPPLSLSPSHQRRNHSSTTAAAVRRASTRRTGLPLHSTPEAIEATAPPGGAKAGNTTTDDRRKDEALVLVQGDEEAALRCHEARLAQELAQVERRKTELRLERLETSLREVSLCRELAGVLRLGCCMMNGKKRKEKVHTDTQSM